MTPSPCGTVAIRFGRRGDDGGEQVALGGGDHRHVEEQHGARRQGVGIGPQPPRGGGDRFGAADGAGAIGLDLRARQQRGQVAANVGHATERRRIDAGQLQLAQRPGDGAGKSRQIGDRREVRQLARLVRIEGSASGNGFGAERAAGRDQPFGQNRQRQPHRQLGERHPRHADQRAAVAGDGEGELVGRGARGADDQHAAVGVGLDEGARPAQAHRGRRLDDDGIPARRHRGPVVEDTRRILATAPNEDTIPQTGQQPV